MLPAKDDYLKSKALDRVVNQLAPGDRLPQAVESCLVDILQAEFDLFEDIEQKQKELVALPDFNPYQLFQKIDIENTHFVDAKGVRQFLKKFDDTITKEDAGYAIRRLDKNDDELLNFIEFLDCIMPFEPAKIVKKPEKPSVVICSQFTGHERSTMKSILASERSYKVSPGKDKSIQNLSKYSFMQRSTPAKKSEKKDFGSSVNRREEELKGLPEADARSEVFATKKKEIPNPEGDLKEILKIQYEFCKARESIRANLCGKDAPYGLENLYTFFNIEKQANLPTVSAKCQELGIPKEKVDTVFGIYFGRVEGAIPFENFDDLILPKHNEDLVLDFQKRAYEVSIFKKNFLGKSPLRSR